MTPPQRFEGLRRFSVEDFAAYLKRHWTWSLKTFGPGKQTGGLTRHIEEELAVIHRYTKSQTMLGLHRLHRFLMTSVYSMLNG